MSAPPQSSPSSSPPKAPFFAERIQQAQQSPNFKFEPSLPPSFSREARAAATRPKRGSIAPPTPPVEEVKDEDSDEDELDVIGVDTSANVFDGTNDTADTVDEEDEDEDQTLAVSQRIAQGVALTPISRPSSGTPWYLRVLILLVTLASSAGVYNYKQESSPIGYCDTGKNTNNALEALNAKWDAIEACNQENRTFLQLPGSGQSAKPDDEPILCPPPALVPFLHATKCTPCPDHASCTKDGAKCDNGYLLRPHPIFSVLSPFGLAETPAALQFQKLASDALNGLPVL